MEINSKYYKKLLDDSSKLNCLENGGVDNWEGYGISLEDYHKEKEFEGKVDELGTTICETLVEGVEEPAGAGDGYGFKEDCTGDVKILIKKFMQDNK